MMRSFGRFLWFFLTTTCVTIPDLLLFVQGADPPPRTSSTTTGSSNSNPPASPRPLSIVEDALGSMMGKAQRTVKAVVEEMMQSSTFAASVTPVVQKLHVTKDEASLLFNTIRKMVNWEDMIFIMALAWMPVPFMSLSYNNLAWVSSKTNKTANGITTPTTTTTTTSSLTIPPRQPPPAFPETTLYLVANHVQQLAKIALVVYAVDIAKMFCVGLGFDFCKMTAFPHAFAQTAYAIWFAGRLAALKTHLLRQYVSQHPETFGRMKLVSRLMNAVLIAGTLLVVLSVLHVQMGVAMHSFLALGSVGTLSVGLASQGIAKEILQGLMLVSSDRIYEGDAVKFGNGLEGTVVQLGWMETTLRDSNEVMVSIPNTHLANQQVSNLSRVRYSAVRQTLRFKYDDAEKLPNLMATIKQEIRQECPALITDGTRPFRAVWSDYGPNHLEVQVECHFRIKPLSDRYWANRQRVLQSIRTAVFKHEMVFAAN